MFESCLENKKNKCFGGHIGYSNGIVQQSKGIMQSCTVKRWQKCTLSLCTQCHLTFLFVFTTSLGLQKCIRSNSLQYIWWYFHIETIFVFQLSAPWKCWTNVDSRLALVFQYFRWISKSYSKTQPAIYEDLQLFSLSPPPFLLSSVSPVLQPAWEGS